MKKRKFYLITTAVVIIIIIVSLIISKTNKGSSSIYKTELPATKNIVRKIFASGTILPNKEVEIKSQVSGIADRIYVYVGQKVKKGDKLAKIKLVPDPESINSAESALKIAKINLDESLKQYDRQKQLYGSGIIAEVEFDNAEKEYKIRQEGYQTAENRLQLLKEGAAKKVTQQSNLITSTVEGTVLGIGIKEGGSVMGRSTFSEGTTILVIADMNNLIFEGSIGESDVAHLELGMELKLTIGAINDKKFKAILGFIAPKGHDEEGTVKFDMKARVIPQEDIFIRAGYSANAEIVLEQRDSVLAIKERDLEFRNDSAFVDIESGIDNFEEKYVEVGLSDGIYIEILSGINKDDKIKTRGSSVKNSSVSVSVQ